MLAGRPRPRWTPLFPHSSERLDPVTSLPPVWGVPPARSDSSRDAPSTCLLGPEWLDLRERRRRHSRGVAFVDEKSSGRRAMAATGPTKMPVPNRRRRTDRGFAAWGLFAVARHPPRALGWWGPCRRSAFQSRDASPPSPVLMVPVKSVGLRPPQRAGPLARVPSGSRGLW
jgi:hypothetical protein